MAESRSEPVSVSFVQLALPNSVCVQSVIQQNSSQPSVIQMPLSALQSIIPVKSETIGSGQSSKITLSSVASANIRQVGNPSTSQSSKTGTVIMSGSKKRLCELTTENSPTVFTVLDNQCQTSGMQIKVADVQTLEEEQNYQPAVVYLDKSSFVGQDISLIQADTNGKKDTFSYVTSDDMDYFEVKSESEESNPSSIFSPDMCSSNFALSTPEDEATQKKLIRLLKNREAAKECRKKKKEYVKCLENRVNVLENQNKALIDELKSLKELYCQK